MSFFLTPTTQYYPLLQKVSEAGRFRCILYGTDMPCEGVGIGVYFTVLA